MRPFTGVEKDLNVEFDSLPNTMNNKRKRRGKLQALHRLARLWAPTERTLVLTACTDPSGKTHSGSAARRVSHTGRAPTFQSKPVDLALASDVLSRWATPLKWDLAKNIDSSSYVTFLNKVSHSAPGPDGIPYASGRAAGTLAADALWEFGIWVKMGNRPFISFHDSLMVFPPKGSKPEDLDLVTYVDTAEDGWAAIRKFYDF